MSNTFSFAVLSQAQILDHDEDLLIKLSELFGKNYGVWSDKGPRPGKPVTMTIKLIKHLLLFDEEACGVVVASEGDPLNVIGQAFYYKFSTHNLGNVCWITQLVTCRQFRRKGIATKLVNVALRSDNFNVCGLVTSNPYAIRALERASSSICNRTFIENHSNELIQNSTLPYIDHNMIVDKNVSINTQFYIDHTKVSEIIEKEKKASRWKFGELLDGHEFFCFVKLT